MNVQTRLLEGRKAITVQHAKTAKTSRLANVFATDIVHVLLDTIKGTLPRLTKRQCPGRPTNGTHGTFGEAFFGMAYADSFEVNLFFGCPKARKRPAGCHCPRLFHLIGIVRGPVHRFLGRHKLFKGFVQQCQTDGLETIGEDGQIIPAFRNHHQRSIDSGRFNDTLRHDVVHVWCQATIAQQITLGGIGTTGNHDQVRLELFHDGQDQFAKGCGVFTIPHATLLERNVNISSNTTFPSRFVILARTGIKPAVLLMRSPVNGKVKDVGVFVR
mmetsp:Transcript_7685/g.14598  ORF Transcript_7685/g.14598 Transcript_7685/m.14598 type:complete len:272 (+) Transcript_7685:119-934(+)